MPQNPKQYLAGYTSLSSTDLASFLRREFSAEEQAQADLAISAVEAEIATKCGRQFAYVDDDDESIVYAEYFDLPGNVFFTHAFPVATIETVKVSGVEQSLTENSDYFIYDSHLEFDPALFANNKGQKALYLEYTMRKFWGDEVAMLALKLAGQLWLSSEDGGMGKREISFASIRQVFDTDVFAKEINTIIKRYRKRLV